MSTSDRPVKTRFAPSPTGVPHVGLVRTALYNWAYAKHMGGTFLFRIEDTDASRNTVESEHALIEALTWLGITSDEGVTAGGELGPYRQSERHAIYAEVLNKLVAAGLAYESFSTTAEIEARNISRGLPARHGYDNHDRNLTDAERNRLRAAGVPAVYRLRMPDEVISFTDLVRGPVTFPVGSTADFVIARGDGSHLYAFVNALDDALMRVTHVLRGEDLLPSTPRQIAVYRALIELGITDFIPEFGHLPYIMGEDGKKLSKRNPKSNLFNLRDEGFLPSGLLNYLALLGWSVAADRDVFDIDELVEKFDVRAVNPNPARFDELKAGAINAEHLRKLGDAALLDAIMPYLQHAAVFHSRLLTPYLEKGLLDLMPELSSRIRLLKEAVPYLKPVLARDFMSGYTASDTVAVEMLNFLHDTLENLPGALFTAKSIEVAVTDAMAKNPEITNKTLWRPVRLAITGQKISLPLYLFMATIGKYETMRRLRSALSR